MTGCHKVLRGHWCDIIVLNVHAPSEDKSDDSKDRFYEKLEQVFDHFPKYHMKILLGDFNAKVGRENIFGPTIGNESVIRTVMIMVLRRSHTEHSVRYVCYAREK
jgi:hypothetical protein